MDLNNLQFVDVPIIQKNVSPKLGKILGDIESRMPAGHIYKFADDLITWAHETTHGLNANIRNAHYKPGLRFNAFYILDGKAVLLEEPANLKLSTVAPKVPQSLRGKIYQLYMIDQQKYWNDRPLYTWDEWTAYANGTATRTDLKITNRAETVAYMWEMAVYGSYIAMHTTEPAIRDMLRYLLDRTQVLYYSSKSTEQSDAYLQIVEQTPELIEYWGSVDFKFLRNV